MNRKQVAAVAVIVLATTLIGLVLTATMPVWLTVIFAMPTGKRNELYANVQTKMAREMMRFMFRSKSLRAVAL